MMNRRRIHTVQQTRTAAGLSVAELIVVVAILAVLALLFLPGMQRGGDLARQSQCRNNLKQIGIGLHIYMETHGVFPPPFTVDAEGRPLHSWRTLILPFCDNKPLYDKIDLSRPWDDPVNEEARKQIVDIYSCPSFRGDDPTSSTYLAIVAPGSVLQAGEPRKLENVTDGVSETVMIVEVSPDEAVHWMAPVDTDAGVFQRMKTSGSFLHRGGAHALLVDGSVRFLMSTLKDSTWQALLTCAGQDDVSDAF